MAILPYLVLPAISVFSCHCHALFLDLNKRKRSTKSTDFKSTDFKSADLNSTFLKNTDPIPYVFFHSK